MTGMGAGFFYNLRPIKGKRLTTFCASLALFQPLLSLTHWIFRSLTLPYKSSAHSASTAVTDLLDFRVADAPLQIQFASAKCVRCASLRSGGRRLAARTAMDHPISALPRTPFCLFEAFHPQGSVSLDSRVASLPYESSSLATSRGNKKYGEEKQRVIYFMYHFGVFPLWWLAPPPFPRKRGHYKAPLCCELLMKGLFFRALFCPLNRGKSGTAG